TPALGRNGRPPGDNFLRQNQGPEFVRIPPATSDDSIPKQVVQMRCFAMSAIALAACVLCQNRALALIERLLPLATILDDADEVFVARIEKIDAEKPSAVLVWDRDIKGTTRHRRLPVNLAGDKEKHTPELLKRIAPRMPVVLFVTDRDDKHLALG